MSDRISQFQTKEVINVRDGGRIGSVGDIEIDTTTGRILSIIVFGRGKVLGVFGKDDDFVIKWENIEMIGDDTILVNVDAFAQPPRRKAGGIGRFFS